MREHERARPRRPIASREITARSAARARCRAGPQRRCTAATAHSVSLDHLLAAKTLAEQLRGFKVGVNTWYLTANGASHGVLKVRHGIIEEISSMASSVAITVEEQNRAVAGMAEGINRASSEAKSGAEAMSRVAGASSDARDTAADVKSLADTLLVEAQSLNAEVLRFLTEVRAA